MRFTIDEYYELRRSDNVKKRKLINLVARGTSLSGIIEPGDKITLMQCRGDKNYQVGELVACYSCCWYYIRLIQEIQGKRIRVGNTHGFSTDWLSLSQNPIWARVIQIG